MSYSTDDFIRHRETLTSILEPYNARDETESFNQIQLRDSADNIFDFLGLCDEMEHDDDLLRVVCKIQTALDQVGSRRSAAQLPILKPI